MSSSNPRRCGVIGLGMIGAGVAECLVRAGHSVHGFDVRPEAISAVSGLRPCATPAELARASDLVLVAVVHASQAREALFGPQGVAEGAHPGLVVALMSTVSVAAVHELAALAQQRGFRLIDVAITTGSAPTSSGTAGLMAGGDAETVESVRGVMEDFSSIYAHMGPLGAGMTAKIARNIMQYGSMLAAYEGGRLAEAAGVDLAQLVDVIRTSDPHNKMSTALLQARGTTRALDGVAEEVLSKFRGWAVQLHKDLDAGLELGREFGIPLPGARLSMEQGDIVYGLPAGTTPPGGRAPAADPSVRGREVMDAVYGAGAVPLPPPGTELPPYVQSTIDVLFADIWTRGALSVRDRRLLVLGANAQVMRADLIEVLAFGALVNQELTPEQLREAVLHLAFYVGWPRATALSQGIEKAIARHQEQPHAQG